MAPCGRHLEDAQVGYKDWLLASGYAVIGTSLNVFGTNCADLISAESVMMLKESFIKRFGAPRDTIGAGGSGGSMQQSMIGSNYPGLLDGILPGHRDAKLWELFVARFQEVYKDAQDDFDSLYGHAFTQAYEAEVRRARSDRRG